MKKMFISNNGVTVEIIGATADNVAIMIRPMYGTETAVQLSKEEADELFSFLEANNVMNGFQRELKLRCKARYKETVRMTDGTLRTNYKSSNRAEITVFSVCGIATFIVCGDGTIDSIYGRFAIDVATQYSGVKKLRNALTTAMGEAAMSQWRRW